MLLTQALGLNLRQSEVDFVIPNLAKDLGLYVDPFLFYRSNNPLYQRVHATLHEFFALAIEKVREDHLAVAEGMIQFPEVREIMMGMSKQGHDGRGMGSVRGRIIFDEIVANADIQEKGLTHLAEMQLLIEGVGYDLISDMCTNIAKHFFVEYTQTQCLIHAIALEKGICLEHVFDWETLAWDDVHVDLPVNPRNGRPILLVPKDVVRRFPVFDFRDFYNTTYRYILRDIELDKSLKAIAKQPKIKHRKQPRIFWKDIHKKYGFDKKTVVRALHDNPELRHRYVETLEKRDHTVIAADDLYKVKGADRGSTTTEEFAAALAAINPGQNDARTYERLILRILTKLFTPPLHSPEFQVGSYDGREIIDITFYNGAHEGFWADVKAMRKAQLVVFECKNMTDLSNEEFFQLSARLNDVRGFFGILVSRAKDNLDMERAYRRLNTERKVILTLSDADLLAMTRAQENAVDEPTIMLQRMYRSFIDKQ